MYRTMALVAALLVIAGGACLLHAGEPTGGDLCFAHVATTNVPRAAFVPGLTDDIEPAALLAIALDRLDLATPPPRA
jgi:hypothetical protein